MGTSWYIVFLGEGCECVIGKHIKICCRYDYVVERAKNLSESQEYKDAKYVLILTEKEYNLNFK
jgi:hypothetical protein